MDDRIGKYTGGCHPWHFIVTTLMAASGLALAGCKGNPTNAASPEHEVSKPPAVTAFPVAEDLRHADPLTSPLWQAAQWTKLSAPANTMRTTAPSRGALLFDADTLYVAFVNDLHPARAEVSILDDATLFLDTTPDGDGRELLEVSVNAAGTTACTWIRTATPALPREDGTPDLGHPVSAFPGLQVPGFWANVGTGTDDGRPVWTAVVAIPLKRLPAPLATSPAAGAHWKFNLVRTIRISPAGSSRPLAQLQSNLSPVYVDAQPVSPYRLADLQLKDRP